MKLAARASTLAFGLTMAVYPFAAHALPVVATFCAASALLVPLAIAYPRRVSAGPAILLAAAGYVASVSGGPVDALAVLPAGAAILFLEGTSLCALLTGGSEVDREVIIRRVGRGMLLAGMGAAAGVACLALNAATIASGVLGLLVATASCGVLLVVAGGSRSPRRGPKAQDVP